jgi:hypothetical protein
MDHISRPVNQLRDIRLFVQDFIQHELRCSRIPSFLFLPVDQNENLTEIDLVSSTRFVFISD